MALMIEIPTVTSQAEGGHTTLSTLEHAGVILSSLKAVVRVAPFGCSLQACFGLALVTVDNVKNMQSIRASEDRLSKRVVEILKIITDALRNRQIQPDVRQLKQDLRPLEVTMEAIAIFTNRQRENKSFQRFIDARDDLKKVKEFHLNLTNSLLHLHRQLSLESDVDVNSRRSAQKKEHSEPMHGHSKVLRGDEGGDTYRQPHARETFVDSDKKGSTSRAVEARYGHDRLHLREPTEREVRQRNDPIEYNAELDGSYHESIRDASDVASAFRPEAGEDEDEGGDLEEDEPLAKGGWADDSNYTRSTPNESTLAEWSEAWYGFGVENDRANVVLSSSSNVALANWREAVEEDSDNESIASATENTWKGALMEDSDEEENNTYTYGDDSDSDEEANTYPYKGVEGSGDEEEVEERGEGVWGNNENEFENDDEPTIDYGHDTIIGGDIGVGSTEIRIREGEDRVPSWVSIDIVDENDNADSPTAHTWSPL